MNENQIADIWILFKEYLDRKLVETVAERYIDLLADHGVSDRMLESSTGVDDDLDTAIEYYLDQGNDEEDEYEEDNWDYDGDEDE